MDFKAYCMSDSRYQVDVSVVTRFLAEQSQPDQKRFAFAYTITVHNNGELPAQLLSRHWVITDGDGNVEEIHGEGVVGQQPLIKAGQSHTYSSGTVMATLVGNMQGSYQMLAEDGKRFDANIAPFRLAVPGSLH
jgi:ApaG protein